MPAHDRPTPPTPAPAWISKAITTRAALQHYLDAGIIRNERTVIKYCSARTLDTYRDEALGSDWWIEPSSVQRHISMIKAKDAIKHLNRPVPPGPERAEEGGIENVAENIEPPSPAPARPFAPSPARAEEGGDKNMAQTIAPPSPAQSGTGAPGPKRADEGAVDPTPMTLRYIDRVEKENEFLRGQIDTKDMQLKTANQQITDLLERSRNELGFMDRLGGLLVSVQQSFSKLAIGQGQQSRQQSYAHDAEQQATDSAGELHPTH